MIAGCVGPEDFIAPFFLLGLTVAGVTAAIVVGSAALRRRERESRREAGQCRRCGNPLWGMATCVACGWQEPAGFEVIQ